VQQVLLKVKIMEVSRTKLRQLGVDWAWFGGGNGSFGVSRVGGLISTFDSAAKTVTTSADTTATFGVIGDNGAFFGALDALQNRQCAKILADPNIVAVSGRPAQFMVGGEVPILVPQSLGTSSIEYKPFGTQVDFLPIVLGNGNIRLEVRPKISFLDPANGIVLNGINVPGFNTRQVDTAVEMKAGQTFALAGLVQERTDTLNRGLPYLSDVPILGVPFRRTRDETNEIELLIVITPEFVDPIDACEAPCGGPGYTSVVPTTKQMFCGGRVEVSPCCNPTQGLQSCGQDPCGGCNNGCQCNGAPVVNGGMPVQGGQNMMPRPATQMPIGTGSEDSSNGTVVLPSPDSEQAAKPEPPVEATSASPAPHDLTLPESAPKAADETKPAAQPPLPPQPAASATPVPPLPKPALTPPTTPVPGPTPNGANIEPMSRGYSDEARANGPYSTTRTAPEGTTSAVAAPARIYTAQRQPVFMRNASRPYNPQTQQSQPSAPGLIGPVGYDVQQ
jgi:pilus assembly protein CpaC